MAIDISCVDWLIVTNFNSLLDYSLILAVIKNELGWMLLNFCLLILERKSLTVSVDSLELVLVNHFCRDWLGWSFTFSLTRFVAYEFMLFPVSFLMLLRTIVYSFADTAVFSSNNSTNCTEICWRVFWCVCIKISVYHDIYVLLYQNK